MIKSCTQKKWQNSQVKPQQHISRTENYVGPLRVILCDVRTHRALTFTTRVWLSGSCIDLMKMNEIWINMREICFWFDQLTMHTGIFAFRAFNIVPHIWVIFQSKFFALLIFHHRRHPSNLLLSYFYDLFFFFFKLYLTCPKIGAYQTRSSFWKTLRRNGWFRIHLIMMRRLFSMMLCWFLCFLLSIFSLPDKVSSKIIIMRTKSGQRWIKWVQKSTYPFILRLFALT